MYEIRMTINGDEWFADLMDSEGVTVARAWWAHHGAGNAEDCSNGLKPLPDTCQDERLLEAFEAFMYSDGLLDLADAMMQADDRRMGEEDEDEDEG
jgi:hypothetical protein